MTDAEFESAETSRKYKITAFRKRANALQAKLLRAGFTRETSAGFVWSLDAVRPLNALIKVDGDKILSWLAIDGDTVKCSVTYDLYCPQFHYDDRTSWSIPEILGIFTELKSSPEEATDD
mgnify:CR=1 FL=1